MLSKMKMLVMALIVSSPAPLLAAQTKPAAVERGYVLGAGDIVEVEVLGQADFGKPRVRVRPDESIALPMVGVIAASGRTPTELAAQIENELRTKSFYKMPTVNVEIVSYASRYVIALGAVVQPGLVAIDRPYRLSEILARVGGAKENAADYVILSSVNGTERRLPIAQLARAGTANDPMVAPDDKIFIPTAELFYIYGQVNAPGAYPLLKGMTLRQALARGGGPTASGSEKRMTLYRGPQKVKLGLETALQPGDVVMIGERLF